MTQKAQSKHINIINKSASPLFAYADETMIKQVLLNLLSNAIKFTPKQGSIEIHIHKVNSAIKTCIKDSGVGISEEKVKKILERDTFYSTSGTNEEKGTGLGLMICKEFIKKNNGELQIKSEVDKGSTFCFMIPGISEHSEATPL